MPMLDLRVVVRFRRLTSPCPAEIVGSSRGDRGSSQAGRTVQWDLHTKLYYGDAWIVRDGLSPGASPPSTRDFALAWSARTGSSKLLGGWRGRRWGILHDGEELLARIRALGCPATPVSPQPL